MQVIKDAIKKSQLNLKIKEMKGLLDEANRLLNSKDSNPQQPSKSAIERNVFCINCSINNFKAGFNPVMELSK